MVAHQLQATHLDCEAAGQEVDRANYQMSLLKAVANTVRFGSLVTESAVEANKVTGGWQRLQRIAGCEAAMAGRHFCRIPTLYL